MDEKEQLHHLVHTYLKENLKIELSQPGLANLKVVIKLNGEVIAEGQVDRLKANSASWLK